jgi:hypothetical protein
VLQLAVQALDHHDRGVDHHADGDGDAAERHDVGVDPLRVHDTEGGEHAERQADEDHQRRAQVQQEHRDHQGDDDHFLAQLLAEVGDGAVDDAGTVIGGDDLDALGQPGLQRLEPVLDVADYLWRAFSPQRMTMTPPTASPSPLNSPTPRRSAGPWRTSATSPSSTGVPRAVAESGTARRSSSEAM